MLQEKNESFAGEIAQRLCYLLNEAILLRFGKAQILDLNGKDYETFAHSMLRLMDLRCRAAYWICYISLVLPLKGSVGFGSDIIYPFLPSGSGILYLKLAKSNRSKTFVFRAMAGFIVAGNIAGKTQFCWHICPIYLVSCRLHHRSKISGTRKSFNES